MAGPLSGIVGNQQVAAAQTTQVQQQNAQNTGAIRPQDQQPEENAVQPQGAAVAEGQESNSAFQQRIEDLISNPGAANAADGAEVQRGALVDVLI